MTKHEIIDLIAAKYNLGNRAIDPKDKLVCSYLTPDGKECAFAIMIKPEYKNLIKDRICTSTALLKDHGFEIILPEYAGHEIQFYREIQKFHDETENWNELGLSPKGERKVRELKNLFNK